MRRLAAATLAATIALACLACTRDAESQAQRDPGAPPVANASSTLPLAPDVDPCQLSASVIGVVSGLSTDRGVFTSTGDAAGECVYAESDGDQLVVTVDTSAGTAHYDEVNEVTAGDDIQAVGSEAFWDDPTLHVLSDGHYWTFTLDSSSADGIRRQTVAIAVAQSLEL